MGDSSSGSDVEECSAMQQPSLLDQIKTILDEYPDDGQILKELIQNADDAKASEMKILYEGRQLNQPMAKEKKYRKFLRAPALVVYNDAKFTEQDWKGIKMIYNSVKAEDPLKIGRFGLGFKSVFHVTDYPCIVSGKKILFLNPHEDGKDKRNSRNVCVSVKLKRLKKCKNIDIDDCLRSFEGTFGFTKETLSKGKYNGTMFWFPLRSTSSDLSDNIYSEENVLDLFEALKYDSQNCVLFLKHLSRVKLYASVSQSARPFVPKGSKDESSLRSIDYGKNEEFYSVEMVNETFLNERKHFIDKLEANGKTIPKQAMHFSCDVVITTVSKHKGRKDKIKKSRWFITNYLKSGNMSDRLQRLLKDKTLCYHPFVGIAAPINKHGIYEENDGGHIFCFQPLPQDTNSLTNLHVHVNAFFAMSQNRRHLKWPSADQEENNTHMDKAIEWNLVLASEVLPDAYIQLVEDMIQLSKKEDNPLYLVKSVYNAIPDVEYVHVKWKPLAKNFLKLATNRQILFTENGGGRWINAGNSVVAPFKNNFPLSEQCNTTVIKLLKRENVDLVQISDSVLRAIKHISKPTEVSPHFLSEHLKQSKTYVSLDNRQKEHILMFLSFEASYDLLKGLKLLPLEDGTFKSFGVGPCVYIDTIDVVKLFPGQEHKFVATTTCKTARSILQSISVTGYYQIRNLDWDALVDMIEITLRKHVGVVPRISAESLKGLWELLSDKYTRSVNVQKLSTLPMFPITSDGNRDMSKSFKLLPLSDLLLKTKKNKELSINKHVCESFGMLSVNVVHNVPAYIQKDMVRKFLYNESSESIVLLLEQLTTDQVNVFNTKSKEIHKNAFVSFVSSKLSANLSGKAKSVLRKLKMWKEYSSLESLPIWVSLKHNSSRFDGREFPVSFPLPKLRTESQFEITLKALEVTTYDQIDMAVQTLQHIEYYSQPEVIKFMYWLLEKSIYHENQTVLDLAKRVRFVMANGKLHIPKELFDHTDKLLRNFFKDEISLPTCTLSHNVLPGLRALGLKQIGDVTVADIHKTCTLVHNMANGKRSFNRTKAQAVLPMLNKKHHLLNQCSLHDLRCISVSNERGQSYPKHLPYFNDIKDFQDTLLLPGEITSSKYAFLVGSTTPVIDCEHMPEVADHFRWNIPPDVNTVVEHLVVVIKTYTAAHKSSYLSTITRVYEWLSMHCNVEDVKLAFDRKYQEECIGCIWIGDGFVSAEKVLVQTKSGDISLVPFLNILPPELQWLQSFFISLGCIEKKTMDVYIDVLQKINVVTETNQKLLSVARLRNMAILVLNTLMCEFAETILGTVKPIYIPVYTGDETKMIMKPASQCTFCDAKWLKDVDFNEDEDDIVYVHTDVSNSIAEALGVPSLTHQILSDAEAFEEWGQEEPLTRRLKYILKNGYVDGFSVPKELFQNADDAGAFKFWMLYDERENEHCRTNLISEGMAQCQGPALWVYNDAEFSEEDFKNITKLSGATKESDASKIGKFGLGFCAVYNITDVPSIVSGENLVIFDPHKKYLENALPGKSPGLKINFRKMKNQKMMKKCANQFEPYENVFKCHILSRQDSYFKGTLFRFPLRNASSEISELIYTRSEALKLIDKIVEYSANMLIFSQSVQDVRLYHLAKNATDPSKMDLLFNVSKDKHRIVENSKCTQSSILKEASSMKINSNLQNRPLKALDEISISWKHYSNLHTSSKSTKNVRKNRQTRQNFTTWLVAWTTGTDDKTWELARAEAGALPLGAIAVPVRKLDNSYTVVQMDNLPEGFYTSGHVFFFLPLPIQQYLPFHINGQFAVTSDRRQLCTTNEDDKSTKMKDWNDSLLKDAIVSAFFYLLDNMRTLGKVNEYTFFELWPTDDSSEISREVANSFYRKIVTSCTYEVFESRGQWFEISKCIFLDPILRQNEEIGDIAFECLLHFSVGSVAIDIPGRYHTLLQFADSDRMRKATVTTETFLLEYFFPNIHKLETNNAEQLKRNLLLKFAINVKHPAIDAWLRNYPSIPTKPSSRLQKPSKLIEEKTHIAALFTESEGRYPVTMFAASSTRKRLRQLGMSYDTLSDADVIDRAATIEQLNRRCLTCQIERSNHLIRYLCYNVSKHAAAVKELKSAHILPVLKKPANWPFSWTAEPHTVSKELAHNCDLHIHKERERYNFAQPSKLYDKRCQNMVGCLHLIFDPDAYTRYGKILPNSLDVLLKCIGVQGLHPEPIDVSILARQLKTLASTYKSRSSSSSRVATEIVRDVYKSLNKCCKDASDSRTVKAELANAKVVWVSDCFTTPITVASNFPIDCPPYLFGLHSSVRHYNNLWKALEIKSDFEPVFVATVLQNIHEKSKGKPLATDFDKVLLLLQAMFDGMKKNGKKRIDLIKSNTKAIYAPDENKIMRDTATMCFDDYSSIPKCNSMNYIHGRISKEIAKAFDVKPKLRQNLSDISDDIEDFFQDEPLVTRLHNLVEGYACDVGIFKELLQNADDAGATEIHFVNDLITYGTKHVLDACYEPLQGPALCVFNDSSFTQQDLQGIQMLGKGSKSDDPSKTGQYGVGFNAVYNITDSPSFLTKGRHIETGETLCMFDPMARFIPDTVKSKPGKRYKNVNSIRKYHNDVMSGYHEYLFPKNQNGTMFRFPLRTKEMANLSEIKNETIDSAKIENLLEQFRMELPGMMIFLKNLKKVTISKNTKKGLETNYNIGVLMTASDFKKRRTYFDQHRQLCDEFKNNRMSIFEKPQTITNYDISMIESTGGSRKYHVVQAMGYKDLSIVPDIVKKHTESKQLGLFPQGGVALRLHDAESECLSTASRTKKNIHSYVRKNKSDTSSYKNKFMDDNIQSQHTYTDEPRAYCFLPLPLETGLPMHINGHFALDHETRRRLWGSEKGNVETCYKTQWNLCLIRNVISPAYVSLLSDMKKSLLHCYENQWSEYLAVNKSAQLYENLLPVEKHATELYWKELVKCVYITLVRENVHFLPVLNRTVFEEQSRTHFSWTPLKIPGFAFPAHHNDESIDHTDQYPLNTVLRDAGMRVVSLSKRVRSSMTFAGVPIEGITPNIVIDYLCTYDNETNGCCNIKVPCPVDETSLSEVTHVEKLLEYCLKEKDAFLSRIEELPIFLTQDKVLRRIGKENPVFVSLYRNLFPKEHGLFLHESINNLFSSFEGCSCDALKKYTITDFVKFFDRSDYEDLKYRSTWNKHKPSAEWIRMAWTFIMENVSKSEPLQKRETMVRDNLKQLGKLAIIPVTAPNRSVKGQLLPVDEIKSLIDLENISSKTLETTLKRFNILQIDSAVFEVLQCFASGTWLCPVDAYDHIRGQVPNVMKPKELLNCLFMNMDRVQEADISAEGAQSLLDYLLDNVLIFQESDINNTKDQMKTLPIFMSHYGNLVSMSSYSEIALVPEDMPKDGLQVLADKTNLVLLKTTTRHLALYEFLGISRHSVLDIYMRFIIPKHEQMNRISFYKHLKYISECLINLSKNEEDVTLQNSLISTLTDTAFVETKGGAMKKIRDLFNPKNKVFGTFCSESEVLPKLLREDNYITFLKKLGLKNSMTMCLFEKFAGEIVSHSIQHGNKGIIKRKSKLLVKALLQMEPVFFSRESFDKISKTKFVLSGQVDENLAIIHEQTKNKGKLVCLSGSVLYSNITLCWTSTKVLPEWIDTCLENTKASKDQRVKALNILTRPKCEDFVKHCVNVGNALKVKLRQPELNISDTAYSLMSSIYHAFLYISKENEDESYLKALKDVPMIYLPEENMIFSAKNIVNDCQENAEIKPYLIKAPKQYREFHDNVFVLLGAAKVLSSLNYARVLSALKELVKDRDMLPPEQMDATKATEYLIKHLTQEHAPINLQVNKLFLPSEQNTLEEAKHIVVCDSPYFRKRLEQGDVSGLKYMKTPVKVNCKEDDVIECLKKLNDEFRPTMLTELVEEHVDTSKMTSENSRIAIELEDFLHSKSFVGGFVRLAKHVMKHKGNTWDTETECKISSGIIKIRMKHVSGLKTVLNIKQLKNGSSSGFKKVDNTEEDKAVHLKQTSSETLIYFQTNKEVWYAEVKKCLVMYLNECVDSLLSVEYVMLVSEILEQRINRRLISEIMDKNKIELYTFGSEDTIDQFAKPGTFVPKKYHQYLDNDYGVIHEHDYKCVAYEVEDFFLDEEAEVDTSPTYVFARIVRKLEPYNSKLLFQRYEVDIGEECLIEAPAYMLYTFKRREHGPASNTLVVLDSRDSSESVKTFKDGITLKDTFNEIRDHLREAWIKEEKERRHIVKRLLLKWHPYKNPNNVDLCTKAFQYLQQCLQRLENGLDLLDDTEDDADSTNSNPSGAWFKYSRKKKSKWKSPRNWSWYGDFFRRYPERYSDHGSYTRDRGTAGFPSDFTESEREPYHYHSEAKRWQRQAMSDLGHAKKTMDAMEDPAYNWVCYNCHQAAEKSLKAAWYAKDANKISGIKYSHQLYTISLGLTSELAKLAGQLTALTGAHTRMRYPDMYFGSTIPAEAYHEAGAKEICEIAENIIDMVSRTYHC